MQKDILILIIPIFVIGIFVLSSISAIATIENKKTIDPISDELDQYQEVMTEYAAIPIGNILIYETPIYIQVAQSFIPTKEIITRVELYIGKNSTAIRPLNVSIRKELMEEDLTVTSVDPSDVPTQTYDWVDIDIDDLKLIIDALEFYKERKSEYELILSGNKYLLKRNGETIQTFTDLVEFENYAEEAKILDKVKNYP